MAWGTRVQRPRGWANQKVLYDAKRHTHTAQGLVLSTIWGDLLWVDGGWPGSCHEQELLLLSGLAGVLDEVEVASLLDRGFRGLAKAREHWHAPVGGRAGGGCCTGPGMSSAPPARWFALAAGYTSPSMMRASRTPSISWRPAGSEWSAHRYS